MRLIWELFVTGKNAHPYLLSFKNMNTYLAFHIVLAAAHVRIREEEVGRNLAVVGRNLVVVGRILVAVGHMQVAVAVDLDQDLYPGQEQLNERGKLEQ